MNDYKNLRFKIKGLLCTIIIQIQNFQMSIISTPFWVWIQRLSQNWYLLSLDRLVMLSIRIRTNYTYSVVDYLRTSTHRCLYIKWISSYSWFSENCCVYPSAESRHRPIVAIPGKGVWCQWGQFGMRASLYAPPNIDPSAEQGVQEEVDKE